MQRLPLPLSCLLCVYIQRNMRVNTGKGKGRRHWQLDTSVNILVARVSTRRISRHTSILYLSPSNRELRPYTVRVVYRLWNSYGLYKRFLLDVKAFWVKWVHTQPSSAIVLLFTNFTRFLMVQIVKKIWSMQERNSSVYSCFGDHTPTFSILELFLERAIIFEI